MVESGFRLLPQEEVVYEGPGVVLTSHRLMANGGRSSDSSFDEALLTDLAPPRKYNRGTYSRMSGGVQVLLVGAGILGADVLLEMVVGLHEFIAALLFLAGTMGVVVGLHFIVSGLLQAKPKTTMVFPKMDGGDISVSFPGWDNSDAQELTRQFARAKRGF